MAQLTKEHFNKVVRGLATKKALDHTNKTLDRAVATLDRTTALLANLAGDFGEYKEQLKDIPGILESHTISLDKILKNTEHWKTEAHALRSALKRHEDWISVIAQKVGVKLEGLEETKNQ